MYVEDLTGKMAKKRPRARTLQKHCAKRQRKSDRVRKGSEKATMCEKAAKKRPRAKRLRKSGRAKRQRKSDRVRKGCEKATACEKAAKKRPRASALCARTLQKRLCAKSQRFSFFEMGLAAGGLCGRFVHMNASGVRKYNVCCQAARKKQK